MYAKNDKMQQVTFQVKARRTDLEARLGLKESFANGPSYNPVKIATTSSFMEGGSRCA